jgi:acetyl-CoA carboxylase beta subunit
MSQREPTPNEKPVLSATETASTRAAQASQNTEDIWVKCPICKEIAFHKEVERNLNVCGKCGHHFRVTLAERLSITADRGSWRELLADIAIGDPLEFVDSKPYPSRLAQARKSSGRNDAVVVGTASIEGHPVALAIMDFEFMGGSMGVVVSRGRERATAGVVCRVRWRADARGRALIDADGESVVGDRTNSRCASALHQRAMRSDHWRRRGVFRDAWGFESL